MNIEYELLWSYLVGIASGLTLPALYYLYIYLTKRLPIKRFWKDYISNKTYGILSCSETVIDIDSSSTGLYDSLTIADIKEVLSSFPKTSFKPYSCKRFPPEMNENNIILIGGPISNSLTKMVTEDRQLTALKFDGHKIINKENGKSFEASVENNKVSRDCGLIVRMKSLYNPKYKIIIIAGCYDYGTYLSGKALTTPEILKQIHKKVGDKDFELVVSGEVLGGTPQTPTIIENSIVIR